MYVISLTVSNQWERLTSSLFNSSNKILSYLQANNQKFFTKEGGGGEGIV